MRERRDRDCFLTHFFDRGPETMRGGRKESEKNLNIRDWSKPRVKF